MLNVGSLNWPKTQLPVLGAAIQQDPPCQSFATREGVAMHINGADDETRKVLETCGIVCEIAGLKIDDCGDEDMLGRLQYFTACK